MDKDHMDYMHLRPWTPLFRYPHDDAAGIVVTRADYECFLPEAPLNRTAVEFGLRLMVADASRSPLAIVHLPVRSIPGRQGDWTRHKGSRGARRPPGRSPTGRCSPKRRPPGTRKVPKRNAQSE